MLSSGAQAADFIKVLYPTLQKAGLADQVGIACCDAEGWSDQKSMTSSLSSVNSMLSLITGHSYTSQPTSPISTPHHVWQTEWADLNGAWQGAWYSSGGAGEGMTWANNIHTGLTSANCSGYLYWVGAQGGNTNSKLIKIDGGNVTPSKRLWAFGQFSRAVRPGAVRVGTSGGSLKTTAFKNLDGSVAVLVINGGSSAASLSVSFQGFNATDVKAWLTDNSHDLESTTAQVASGVVTGSVPARAMISFVVSGS
jgi:O-glycosyl hydrolase